MRIAKWPISRTAIFVFTQEHTSSFHELGNQQEKKHARHSWQRTARLVERGVRLLYYDSDMHIFFLLPG
jgi:hypothetical protein